jgi:hypothetical protein
MNEKQQNQNANNIPNESEKQHTENKPPTPSSPEFLPGQIKSRAPEQRNSPSSSPSHALKKDASDDNLPKLRTMKHDAARYLKDRNLSFLDLVAKEHEYAEEHPKKFEYHERITEKAWFRGVLGLVSVVFLAIIGYAVYVFLLTRNTLPTTEAPPARAFISVEEREIITIRDHDRAGLLSKLEASRRNRLPSRSIKHIVVRIESFGGASRFATAKDFFDILDFKLPNGLSANLQDRFDILMYYRSDGADIGLLFEPKSHESALAHMLAWENTIILDFRDIYFDHNVSQPFQLFTDTIIRNIDTRSIALEENNTFSYAIFAQRFLIITTSENFMEVLLGRLLTAPPR